MASRALDRRWINVEKERIIILSSKQPRGLRFTDSFSLTVLHSGSGSYTFLAERRAFDRIGCSLARSQNTSQIAQTGPRRDQEILCKSLHNNGRSRLKLNPRNPERRVTNGQTEESTWK